MMQNRPLNGMTFEEALKFIYNHFGEESQVNHLKEEFMEFLEAIELGDIKKIEEEGVDLLIMIFQFIVNKGADETNMQKIASFKMSRTLELIALGEYDERGIRKKSTEIAVN